MINDLGWMMINRSGKVINDQWSRLLRSAAKPSNLHDQERPALNTDILINDTECSMI